MEAPWRVAIRRVATVVADRLRAGVACAGKQLSRHTPLRAMDSQTLVIALTVIVGLVGAVLFLSQPGEVKTKKAKGGLKPRGEQFAIQRPRT